jgi:general secretion pathway protein A
MAIYEAYYQCQREPFSLSPDPSFLYSSSSHREALAQLRYLVQERKGFGVLTGEVGTGKTMILRTLIETAGSRVQSGYVFNPPRTNRELYRAITEDLEIELDSDGNVASQLNRHLLQRFEEGGTVVMIFDEAQDLPIEVLHEIRLLTNLETSNAKLLQVILAGQPELDAMLETQQLRALRQRLVFRYSLAPLSQADTVSYIGTRLGESGARRSPFTLGACNAVYRYSQGIPRLINVICDNAMLVGYAKDSQVIEEAEIEEVSADLKLSNPVTKFHSARTFAHLASDPPLGRGSWRRRLAVAAVVAVAIAVAALVGFSLIRVPSSSTVVSLVDAVSRLFSNSINWLVGQSEVSGFSYPRL